MTDLALPTLQLQLDKETINRIATRTAELIQSTQSTAPDPADDLITPKQACELLKCTAVTLWRWEKKGKIQRYGIGGKKLFRRSELLQTILKK